MPRKLRSRPNTDDRPGSGSIQVIARAASVLRALEGHPSGLSLAQIAERVGLARSTVQRIVDALRAEQLVIAATPTSGVRLGPALVRLAAAASVDFDQITRPVMAHLSQEIGETVDLSVQKGTSAIFTDQMQGAHRLRAVSAVGETFPLHCTANGKALLSILRPAELDEFLESSLPRLTPNTIVRPQELRREIDSCRRKGVAFDMEEHTEGICAVGTAFVDPLGRRLALSVPVPTTRFTRMRPGLVKHLLDARTRIVEAFQSGSAVSAAP
jgi:DNA-binding IclR family transcriptional regulator